MSRLGQHILVSLNVLNRIAQKARVELGDHILEIGCGPGNLTQILAQRVGPLGRVVGIELDRRWESKFAQRCAESPWVELHWGNALEVDLKELLGVAAPSAACKWKVVANIPYAITSPLIALLLQHCSLFSLLALLIQKEVAERIHATSGRHVGSLSHFIHYHCKTEIGFTVPPQAFRPPPTVESSLLLLIPHAAPPVDVSPEVLFRLIHCAFQARRKMLRRSLRTLPEIVSQDSLNQILQHAQVDGQQRPEMLTLEDFARLAKVWKGKK